MPTLQKHPLHRPKTKGGAILYKTENGTHKFESWVNNETGDRLSSFDGRAPEIGHTLAEIRQIFWNIRKSTEVLEVIGDF